MMTNFEVWMTRFFAIVLLLVAVGGLNPVAGFEKIATEIFTDGGFGIFTLVFYGLMVWLVPMAMKE